MIRITTTGQSSKPETRRAQPSASSADPTKANPGNGFGHQGLRTVGIHADGSKGENGATVRANPLKGKFKADADDADADHPPVWGEN
jgi:hypothetical protein